MSVNTRDNRDREVEFYARLNDMDRAIKRIEQVVLGLTITESVKAEPVSSSVVSNTPATLEALTDTTITSLANDELLASDGTGWKNEATRTAIPELKTFNGITLEEFNALVTSDGATITMTLTESQGANNLTMVFSDGHSNLDVSGGGATIALTAGASDASPQINYIYILQSGKVLVKNTSTWPAGEHIKIGIFFVPTAGFVQTNNVYMNQNINDGTDTSVQQGHFSDMNTRMRLFGANYFSGIDPAGTSDYLTIAASNVEFKSTAGVVYQMHAHTFGAVDTSGGDLVLVKNWSGDSYHDITDLFDIIADSGGTSLNNKWFTLVFWGISNKSGELDYIVINLPSGSYATQAKALEDANEYTDFLIPREFNIDSTTGFLIAAVVVKKATTWSFGSTKDLRGINDAIAVAGGTGTGITDHGSLTGLADDDHSQYLLEDGTRAMSGQLDMGAQIITNVGTVDGVDISARDHAATVAGDLNHNDLANLNAGDVYEHISAAQLAALHAIATKATLGLDTTDSPTFASLTLTTSLILGNDDKIVLGAGSDAEIDYDTGIGELMLINKTNGRVIIKSLTGFDSWLKIDTTDTGVATADAKLSLMEAGGFRWTILNDGSASDVLRFFNDVAAADRMALNAGLIIGAPTGGDKGVGTLNATAVYDDNVLLTCWPIQLWKNGVMLAEDLALHGEKQLYSIDEMKQFMLANEHMPAFPSRLDWHKSQEVIKTKVRNHLDSGDITVEKSVYPEEAEKFASGKLQNATWETIEQLQIYIFELHDRLKILEAN